MPQDPGMAEWWTSRRFSLTNPRDDGSTDLPRLLRRMADEVERRDLDPMDILDLTVSQEMTADVVSGRSGCLPDEAGRRASRGVIEHFCG